MVSFALAVDFAAFVHSVNALFSLVYINTHFWCWCRAATTYVSTLTESKTLSFFFLLCCFSFALLVFIFHRFIIHFICRMCIENGVALHILFTNKNILDFICYQSEWTFCRNGKPQKMIQSKKTKPTAIVENRKFIKRNGYFCIFAEMTIIWLCVFRNCFIY